MRTLLFSLLLTASATAQLPITAWWPLDETSGTTATDISPNNNLGTLVNFTGTPWVAGHIGNGLMLDGVDDYVDLARNGTLPLYRGNGAPFSFTCWLKAPAQDDRRIYSEASSTTNSQQLFTLGSARVAENPVFGSRVRLYIRNDAGLEVARCTSASTVFDDTWHHLAYVDVAGLAVLYVDGVADATSFDYRVRGGATNADNGTNQPSYGRFTFDRASLGAVLRWNTVAFLSGTLDDVRIFGCALSTADVQAVMAGGLPGAASSSFGTFGVPCGVSPLQLAPSGSLSLGQSLSLQCSGGSTGAVGLLMLALGHAQRLDLSPFGYAGCTLYVQNPNASLLGLVSGTPLSTSLAVPNNGALLAVDLTLQTAALGGGVELSRAVIGQVGL